MKRTDIKILIEAMRILSEGIQSEDGVANAAIAEAGQRLQEQDDYIKRLENYGVYWRLREKAMEKNQGIQTMKHTPRTNEHVIINDEGAWVSSAFARALEIDLNNAIETIKLLENVYPESSYDSSKVLQSDRG